MHNPDNERIKRAYFIYLKEARRLGEHSTAPQPRSPGSKSTPNIATSKGSIFSRQSGSRVGCQNMSAHARAND